MKSYIVSLRCFVALVLLSSSLFAQDDEEKKDVHQFTILHNIETTSVKHQGKTGTCWNFATQSFLETELLRMGKGEYDLSEMYIVRNLYPVKAEKYIHSIDNGVYEESITNYNCFAYSKQFWICAEL